MTQNDNSYNPRIKRHLDLLRDTPPRDSEAAELGKQNFLKLAASLPVPVSVKRSLRLNEWLLAITKIKERRVMFTITTLIVVLTMLFGGAGATVYAAQDSMPNDTLYTVKTWSEDIKLGLTSDPEAKYGLLESYVSRRLAELDRLLAEGEEIPDDFVTRMQDQVNAMGDTVAQMDNKDSAALLRPTVRDSLRSPCDVLFDENGDLILDEDGVENARVPEWALAACEQLRAMRSESDACDDIQGCKGVPLKAHDDDLLDIGGNGPGPAGDDTLVPPNGSFGPRGYDCTINENTGEETCIPVGGPNTVPVAPQTSPSVNYQNQGGTSQQGNGSINGSGGTP